MGAVRTLALRREPGTWALIASLVRPSPVSASSSSLIGALLLAGELGGLCFRMLNIRAAGWPCTRSGARHVSDRREHGHAPATVIQLGLRARPSSRPLEGREALGSCVRQRTYDRTHGRVSYLSLLSPRVSSREAFTSPSPDVMQQNWSPSAMSAMEASVASSVDPFDSPDLDPVRVSSRRLQPPRPLADVAGALGFGSVRACCSGRAWDPARRDRRYT